MKNNYYSNKNYRPAAIFIGFLLSFLLFSMGCSRTIAVYGLEEKQASALKTELESPSSPLKTKVNVIIYSSGKPLSQYISFFSKPAMIITTAGYGVNEALKLSSRKVSIPAAAVSELTSTMKNSVIKEKEQIKALPVLSDHLEMDINAASFQNSGVKSINTWKELEDFLSSQKTSEKMTLSFAGLDGKFLLSLLGAMAESIDGSESYIQAKKILQDAEKNTFDAAGIAEKLCSNHDSPLITSIRLLNRWYKRGYISDVNYRNNLTDVFNLIERQQTASIFLTLSQHRNAGKRIKDFYSAYIPSERTADQRTFTGTTVYAVPLNNSRKTVQLSAALTGREVQEKISRATGLAPVHSNCRTSDKQADDARYFIAATKQPFAGLGQEIYLTSEQFRLLAKEILKKISE